jgi:murein DD-endopeptidase MepM/ murein hydrolase activator NlpD
LELTNTLFIFEHNKKPIKMAYIYIDLAGTPEDNPAFELDEFSTDSGGKLGFVTDPDETVYRIKDKDYNVYYSYQRIEDPSTITEEMCQRVHMADVIELKKRGVRTKVDEFSDDKYSITFTTYDEGDGRISFYVTNTGSDFIDVRFYFLILKKCDKEFDEDDPDGNATKSNPYKKVVSPDSKEYHLLDIIMRSEDSEYKSGYDAYFGDPSVSSTTENCVLPYADGKEYTVIQGFKGSISHFGTIKYAVDFDMDDEDNDVVCAARSGVVVELEDTITGTVPIAKKDPGNFIRILHDDKTYGYYIHLKTSGVMVSVGDNVAEGDEIASPDHTGSSQEAHLHFDVRVANGSGGWKTISWKFKDNDGKAFEPKKGEKYKK